MGATRLSIVVLVVIAVNTLLGQHWVAHPSIVQAVLVNVGLALILAIAVWVGYVAIEPALRRHAPHLLISWTRLLSGRFRDGLIGRDVLIGCLAALFLTTLHLLLTALPWWVSLSTVQPYSAISVLNDTPHLLGSLVRQIWVAILVTLSTAFCYAAIRLRIRNRWIAAAPLLAIVWFLSFNSEGLFLHATLGAIGSLMFVLVLVRFGLLALASLLYVENLLYLFPPILRPDAWYFAKPLIVALFVIGIAIFAFRSALAGRPMFAGSAEEF